MEPIVIIVTFFAVLGVFMGIACCATSKRGRVIGAVVAFGWAGLMFLAAHMVESFNLNAWYSRSAHDLLENAVESIDQGDAERVSRELEEMRNNLQVTYESRGNFRELAITTAERIRAGLESAETTRHFEDIVINPQHVDKETSSEKSRDVDGRLYKEELISTIQESDKIVVSEHSHEVDFHGSEYGAAPTTIPLYTYRSVVLAPDIKSQFFSEVLNMDPKTQDEFTNCDFIPHHAIKFYKDENLLSTMEVCFECGLVMWDWENHIYPWAILSAVSPTIERAGFQKKRNWGAVAKRWSEK